MRWEQRIGRRIKLRDLHTLQTLAETGSMARAAEHLSITQPAVSKAIADLEATLGVRLFDRSRRGVELTLYGRALLKGSSAAIEVVKEAVRDVESLADPTAGELSLAGNEPMMAGLLPAAIERMGLRYPRITLRVVPSGILEQVYADLRARKLDLVVNRLPPSLSDDLEAQALFEEPARVVAHPSNRHTRRRAVALADLMEEGWVLPGPATAIGSFVVQAFGSRGLPLPRRTVHSNSIQLTLALMAGANYLGIFPASLLHFSGQRLGAKALRVDLPNQVPPVGVVTLKNRTVRPVAKIFVECLREVAKPLAGKQ